MYVVVAEFVVAPEHAAGFLARVVEHARTSAGSERGCRQFDVTVSVDQPTRVLLYEVYDDRAAFEAHVRTAHLAAFDAAVRPWVVEKTVRAFERVEPAPSEAGSRRGAPPSPPDHEEPPVTRRG